MSLSFASVSVAEPRLPAALRDALDFTALYRACEGLPIPEREARCLRFVLPRTWRPIEPGDLLAGRMEGPLAGIGPEPGGFGFFCRRDAVLAAAQQARLDASAHAEIDAMLDFWATECTAVKVRAAYPPELAAALPSDNWHGELAEPGVAFPLYRLAIACPDYERMLRRGISGLADDVRAARRYHGPEAQPLYDGMLTALELLADAARSYRDQAIALAVTASGARRDELERLGAALGVIAERAPATLLEAVELVWLTALVSGTLNFGRMDTYLGDFYARDIDSGELTAGEAQAIVDSLWRFIAARHTTFNGRVIVGGMGRKNEANADRFALAAIEASRRLRDIEPQLTLRFHRAQNPELYERALDALGEGITFPMLYNDDVNVPAVAEAFDVPVEVALDYVPHGCGEYVLAHRSFQTPSGIINLLQAVLVTLANGHDPLSGRPQGLGFGRFEDFQSFDALFDAYAKQLEYYVRACADQEYLEYKVAGEQASFLYLSLLYDDCIARGRAIFDGGLAHLGGTLETYGNISASDSLAAIQKLVFEERSVTPAELVTAMAANFVGHEALRKKLLAQPKYGNDDERADAMARRVHDHVCRVVREQRERTPLDSYLVVIINNDANTTLGYNTAASPDGRRAREPLTNGNNPSPGADRQGVTAFLNSLVKLSPRLHAGSVQNMKFSRELFTSQRDSLQALLATYFDRGGTQAMITVVSRGDLEAALEHPEKYANLMVRVGGFSARFVELPRAVQLDILRRTLN